MGVGWMSKLLAECTEAKEEFAGICGSGVCANYEAVLGSAVTLDTDSALSPSCC